MRIRYTRPPDAEKARSRRKGIRLWSSIDVYLTRRELQFLLKDGKHNGLSTAPSSPVRGCMLSVSAEYLKEK